MNSSAESEELRVGPDVVRVEGGILAVYSRRDMSDWVVREYCQPAIWFQDQKFFLRSRQRVRGRRRWKYSLCPWPAEDLQSPPYAISYSELYVSEREREFRSEHAVGLGRCLLLPFYPLLGFLWSEMKDDLAALGFNARSLTSISIMIELGGAMVLGIFIGCLGFWSVLNVLLFLGLGLDAVFRFDSVLRDHRRQLGLLEWCFRW